MLQQESHGQAQGRATGRACQSHVTEEALAPSAPPRMLQPSLRCIWATRAPYASSITSRFGSRSGRGWHDGSSFFARGSWKSACKSKQRDRSYESCVGLH